jgi:hypothetical protein
MNNLKDLSDFLSITISRQDIEKKNLEPTIEILNSLLVDTKTILKFFDRVDIGITGYDNDPRELWEILEVKQFIRKLDIEFPYWFYFLTKLGGGLKMIAFCCINTTKFSSTQVNFDPVSMEQFYNKHFDTMNQIGELIGMTEEENEELTENVIGYFSS